MMMEETARKIEILKEKVGDRHFTKADCKGIVSPQTLKKYNLIESVEVEVEREEYTLEELLNEINEMIGEDCYGMEGEFILENGKIFYIRKEWGYKFKA